MNSTDMNKINIIKLIPERACECFCGTHAHTVSTKPYIPLLYPQIGQVRFGMVEKAKKREQRSLIDLDFPKTELEQETDPDILNELPIQNLSIQEDREEQGEIARDDRYFGTATRSSSGDTNTGRDRMGGQHRRKGSRRTDGAGTKSYK